MWPRACLCERARTRVFPPPRAKRVQESLDIQTGIPLKWVEGGVREPRLLSSSRFSQVKVIKRFVYWGNAEVPQPSPAPAVASGPRRMRAVRSAPPNARIKAVLQQLPLLLHLWFVCFERRVKTFPHATRRLCLSHIHTLTHPRFLFPRPPFLLSGERQLDGTVHLQKSSLRHVLLQFPGFRRSRVSVVRELLGRFGVGRRRGSELGSLPPARRWSSSVRRPCSRF